MTNQDSQFGPQFTPQRLRPVLEYIDAYWKKLERFRPHDDGTLVGLPHPYFVPSFDTGKGHQFEEIYYWDTYFMAQGLLGTPREYLIKGMTENLMYLQRRFGIIPNSGRLYHTSRSQTPFLSSLIMLVYQIDRNKRWLDNAMTVAKDEYRSVWMGVTHPNWRQVFHGLSRWYDINVLDDLAEAESGWDMTTRFQRQALSYLPVDLNALLYKYERDFAEAALILGETEEAAEWTKRALARKAMMHKYLWNEDKGCYFDYNYLTGKHSPVWSLAAFFPMWVGMDDQKTAARIMDNLDKFEFNGGLATTAYQPEIKSPIPVQWAYPNGWAPLHLVATEAMERYDLHDDAERIARKWLTTNLGWFEQEGEFLEKYNVVEPDQPPAEGVYPTHPGFGWTNAVFERLCQRYLRSDEIPEAWRPQAAESPLEQLVRKPRRTLKRVGAKYLPNVKRLP